MFLSEYIVFICISIMDKVHRGNIFLLCIKLSPNRQTRLLSIRRESFLFKKIDNGEQIQNGVVACNICITAWTDVVDREFSINSPFRNKRVSLFSRVLYELKMFVFRSSKDHTCRPVLVSAWRSGGLDSALAAIRQFGNQVALSN